MSVVLDTSVVVDALIDLGPRGAVARQVVELGGAVPDVSIGETFSAIRRYFLAGRLAESTFAAAVDLLAAMPVDVHATQELLPRMAELSHSVSAFDSAPIALAERLGAPLVTLDAKLAGARGPRCEIRLLS